MRHIITLTEWSVLKGIWVGLQRIRGVAQNLNNSLSHTSLLTEPESWFNFDERTIKKNQKRHKLYYVTKTD